MGTDNHRLTKVYWGQEIPASVGIVMRNRTINSTSIYLLLAHEYRMCFHIYFLL